MHSFVGKALVERFKSRLSHGVSCRVFVLVHASTGRVLDCGQCQRLRGSRGCSFQLCLKNTEVQLPLEYGGNQMWAPRRRISREAMDQQLAF